jgi:heme o synthase
MDVTAKFRNVVGAGLVPARPVPEGRGYSVANYLALTKPRITLLVVLTALAGYLVGARNPFRTLTWLHLTLGVMLLSAGISSLNQYLERRLDGLMRRTKDRPLPSGKLEPVRALIFGVGLSTIGELYLYLAINPLTAICGAVAFASYLFLYTPLKTRSSLSTAVGAIPGAIPPLMGWVAARGELSLEGWVLFAILFLWQFPHFLAIAWLYREDYARAGICMLPVVEPEGDVTGQQIVNYTLLLLPVSLIPAWLGLAGGVYAGGAVLLGVGLLYVSVRTALSISRQQARRLLQASVAYLPLLFALMALNRI